MKEKAPGRQDRMGDKPEVALRQRIATVVAQQPLTPEIARQLTVDPQRNALLVARIALRVAVQSPEELDETALLELVGECLSKAVAEILESREDGEYRNIPGIQEINNGKEGRINFDLGGREWQEELYGMYGSIDFEDSLVGGRIAATNLLRALNVSPEDLRKLTDVLLPIVVQQKGKWVLKYVTKDGKIKDLNSGKSDAGYSLSEITTPRKTRWESRPVYSKEGLAVYLEAVLHSNMPQEEKDRFVYDLLQTKPFNERVMYSRPAYEGGSFYEHESGIRITLPTGQSLRVIHVSDTSFGGSPRYRLRVDSPTQSYHSDVPDVVFVIALVEQGRLPVEALDSIYTVEVVGNMLFLGNTHTGDQRTSINLSDPFNKKIDISPIYLSFLLTRDPRISDQDRKRLRQYFGNSINLKVTTTDGSWY